MSDENTCTWPEQDAVDRWLKKHSLCVTFEQAMELKNSVTEYRIKIQEDYSLVGEKHKHLGKFYGVHNYKDLVDMQSGHVTRLQEKLPEDKECRAWSD